MSLKTTWDVARNDFLGLWKAWRVRRTARKLTIDIASGFGMILAAADSPTLHWMLVMLAMLAMGSDGATKSGSGMHGLCKRNTIPTRTIRGQEEEEQEADRSSTEEQKKRRNKRGRRQSRR
ncbi:hypothetical protein BGW36DRAFT_427385 [Talaromyces proteolyticus]|uniref:Uncharacterized protein n=1 Tax=Talaromyces proteolyticus TaxID=1131652 RepID=A0AAD4KRS9_9EURO|nr:uncharacterized protein BGW36DRAFT_427385 [Talaromyces proteolyticus]KAH8697423.1 hypothetical protein BGW36DRAFT_427385 [Talaromyces proteolyticus]